MIVVEVIDSNHLKVLHYTSLEGDSCAAHESASIREDNIDTSMIKPDDICLINHDDTKTKVYSGQEAVERARSRLGEKNYHIFKNNCECYCNWVKTDKSESPQAKTVVTAGVVTGAVAAVGAVATVAAVALKVITTTKDSSKSIGEEPSKPTDDDKEKSSDNLDDKEKLSDDPDDKE